MLKYDVIKNLDEQYVLGTYRRMPALMVQGAGCRLWDNRGREYLDFLSGIGVCALGHCHPTVVAAISRQAQQLIHVSNLMLTAPQAQLAKRLCELSGMDRAFFAVCGATANEAALKIAKKHGNAKRPEGDYTIVALERSFHGRTAGALSLTGKESYRTPFAPLLPNVVHIEPNDLEALRAAIDHRTAAVFLEPVMGEGGVLDLDEEFVKTAEALCREHDALLVCDEVQCGMGRTGTWFAFQAYGIQPDLVCLAKALGGGVPIGAVLARGPAAQILVPGDHGTTYGGNPLACAAALAVIDTIEQGKLLTTAQTMGERLREGLTRMGLGVRGRGLMLGARLTQPIARDTVTACFERGLIVNATDDFTLRFLPPLIVNAEEVDEALRIVASALGVPTPESSPHRVRESRVPPYGDVLEINDLDNDQLQDLLDLAAFTKHRRRLAPSAISPVEGRTVAMVFEKPSLRTRVSFETAIREVGGQAIYLSKQDIGMGNRESVRDVASNLSRWCRLIVARLYWQRQLVELAEFADVPVINALTELQHPCQALADLLTIRETFGERKVKIAYVGDGNNVARSLAQAATRLGYPFTLVGPANFQLEPMAGLTQTDDLVSGLADASVVYTDVWISMGDEHEQEHRLKIFRDYQVNADVMALADRDAIFLHCLPARRGFEVTDDVIDGRQSRVVDQAENRLHAQRALIERILAAN
jgi:acetylornithine/N-succinyldiaminopimelate aminotransferase